MHQRGNTELPCRWSSKLMDPSEKWATAPPDFPWADDGIARQVTILSNTQLPLPFLSLPHLDSSASGLTALLSAVARKSRRKTALSHSRRSVLSWLLSGRNWSFAVCRYGLPAAP